MDGWKERQTNGQTRGRMKPLVLKSICFLEITCLIHFLIDIGQKGKKSYVNISWFSWHFRPFSSDVLWSSPWLHEHLSPGPMSVSPMAPWDSPSCCHAQMATADCSSASWPHAPCMAPWLSLGPMSFCFLATRASTSWPYELVILRFMILSPIPCNQKQLIPAKPL